MIESDLTPGDLRYHSSRAGISFYLVFSREPLQFVVVWKSGMRDFTAIWVRTSSQTQFFGEKLCDALLCEESNAIIFSK